MGVAARTEFSDQALQVAVRFDACVATFKAARWSLTGVRRLVALSASFEALTASGKGFVVLQDDDCVKRLYPSEAMLSIIEAMERLAAECQAPAGPGVA